MLDGLILTERFSLVICIKNRHIAALGGYFLQIWFKIVCFVKYTDKKR